MRAHFFTPTLVFLILSLVAHTHAQTPNAISKAEKTLASCPLTSDAPKDLLQQIRSGYQGEPCLAKGQFKDSGPLSSDDPTALYDFAQAVWLQSMRNFLQTRLDAELRYRKNQTDPTPSPDVAALVKELCAQSATENVNLKVDRCRYSKVGNAHALLLKSGQDYVAAFREANVPSLSWNEAKTEINGRIERIHAYFEPVRALDPEQYPAKVDLRELKVLHARDGVTVRSTKPASVLIHEQEKRNAAMAQYEALREFELRTGPGILLRAPALSKFNEPGAPPLTSPSAVGAAITQLKTGLNAAAGELNTDVAWAVGLDPSDKSKTPAPGWVSRMMIANPTAVGQVVAQNPAMAGLVCGLLERHEQSEEINQAMMYTMHGMMWVTTLAGGISLVPRVFAMQLGTRATANMLALQAVRTSFGRVGFGGLVSFDGAEQLMLSQELRKARRDLLVGTGVTEKTVAQKEQALSANTATLAGDIAFLVIPKVTTLTPLGKLLTNTATTKQVAELTRFFRAQPAQIQASFEAFSLACSIVEERCAYVMAALHSATAKERLRIMASKQSMAEFIREKSVMPPPPAVQIEAGKVKGDGGFYNAWVISPTAATPLNKFAAAHEKKGITVVSSEQMNADYGVGASFTQNTVVSKSNGARGFDKKTVPMINVSDEAIKAKKPGMPESHEGTHGETQLQIVAGTQSPRGITMETKIGVLSPNGPKGYTQYQQLDEIKTTAQDVARISRGLPEAKVQALYREGLKKDKNFSLPKEEVLELKEMGQQAVDPFRKFYDRGLKMSMQTKELTQKQIQDLKEKRSDPTLAIEVAKDVIPSERSTGSKFSYLGLTENGFVDGRRQMVNYTIPLSNQDVVRYTKLNQLRKAAPEVQKTAEFKSELQKRSTEFLDGLIERVKAGNQQAVKLEETYRKNSDTFNDLLTKENWTLEDYTRFRKAATAPANAINEFYKKEAARKPTELEAKPTD